MIIGATKLIQVDKWFYRGYWSLESKYELEGGSDYWVPWSNMLHFSDGTSPMQTNLYMSYIYQPEDERIWRLMARGVVGSDPGATLWEIRNYKDQIFREGEWRKFEISWKISEGNDGYIRVAINDQIILNAQDIYTTKYGAKPSHNGGTKLYGSKGSQYITKWDIRHDAPINSVLYDPNDNGLPIPENQEYFIWP